MLVKLCILNRVLRKQYPSIIKEASHWLLLRAPPSEGPQGNTMAPALTSMAYSRGRFTPQPTPTPARQEETPLSRALTSPCPALSEHQGEKEKGAWQQ